jgi:hypothetical protein
LNVGCCELPSVQFCHASGNAFASTQYQCFTNTHDENGDLLPTYLWTVVVQIQASAGTWMNTNDQLARDHTYAEVQISGRPLHSFPNGHTDYTLVQNPGWFTYPDIVYDVDEAYYDDHPSWTMSSYATASVDGYQPTSLGYDWSDAHTAELDSVGCNWTTNDIR